MNSCRILPVFLVLAAALAGCDRDSARLLGPNLAPEVRVEVFPAASRAGAQRSFRVRWEAVDGDDRVAAFLWAVDPAAVDRVDAAWSRTADREAIVSFPVPPAGGPRDLHVIAVRAIDERGSMSPPRWVGVYGDNIPPSVQIVSPPPSHLVEALLTPSPTIRWLGTDPDGVFTNRPVEYKFKLIPESDPLYNITFAQPDSLRRLAEPHFADWDSVSGDTTSVQFSNLTPFTRYIFAVVAFDEAGDYSPQFGLDTNLLRFRVVPIGTNGPRITVYNESFLYAYPTGTMTPQPIRVEQAAGTPLTFRWFGEPNVGADIRRYRWVLDPEDAEDETPRSDENTDLMHWSQWSALVVSAELPAFHPPGPKRELHRFYVEAEDTNGLRSRAIVDFVVVPPIFTEALLIVDDTRRRPSTRHFSGCTQVPVGTWPAAAELDSFLYARGGSPIVYCGDVTGLSAPGVFAGYAYDTIGTRGRRDSRLPLSTLSRYRNVIWLVDAQGATYTSPWTDPIDPITGLRSMCSPGQTNVLASYVRQGGNLWLAGGGAAHASSISFNVSFNDVPGSIVLSSNDPRELGPGRFMYEIPCWQSELRSVGSASSARLERRLGRNAGDPFWASLPALLERRPTGSEDPPLGRSGGTAVGFFPAAIPVEFLQVENPLFEEEGSTLDTLYRVVGGTLQDTTTVTPPRYVAMTRCRRENGGSVMFSGFDLWSFRTTQVSALVDFVLRDAWGMSREVVPAVAQRDPDAARRRSRR